MISNEVRVDREIAPAIAVIEERTIAFLLDHLGLVADGIHRCLRHEESVVLRSMTAIVGVGSHTGLYIAYSYDDSLIRAIAKRYTFVKPDLVTMDITMPGMDGIEALTAIMAASAEARVIMVTSHGQEAMVIRALEAGALGYVLKPVAKERLAAMTEKAMNHPRR